MMVEKDLSGKAPHPVTSSPCLLPGLIDYNFLCFKRAIEEIFEVRQKAQGASGAVGATGLKSLRSLSNDSGESPQLNGLVSTKS